MLLVFNCSFWRAITVNHLILRTTNVKMFEKMELDHTWLFTTTATSFFLLPIDSKKFTQKLYIKQNSQFKAPLEQVILIEHLCLQNSCLSGNPEIKTVSLETAQDLLHMKKMSKESSRMPQSDPTNRLPTTWHFL